MIIFAFDPGKTTGFCKIKIDGRKFIPKDAKELTTEAVLWWCHREIVADWSDEKEDIVLVCENYIINPKVYKYDHQADQGLALRLIGALQLTAHVLHWKFVLQMPTIKPAGYGFLKRQYIRDKKGQHIQDAVAHAMFYCVTERIVDIDPAQTVQSTTVRSLSDRRKSRRESVHVSQKKDTQS